MRNALRVLQPVYHCKGQTVESWLTSIRAALRFEPEEIYLYPLYVRPLTGLEKSDREWDDIRLACYREGRSLLLAEGYTQVSMRMFRANHAPAVDGPVYCCQAEGMVGLGCGARSYTDSLHYSYNYAVSDREVRHILEAYINTSDTAFDYANYGFQLNAEERRRRYILLSLLSDEGLNFVGYRDRFSTDAFINFPELSELLQLNLGNLDNNILRLTEAGVERSDTIGSWFFSDNVRQLMQNYELK